MNVTNKKMFVKTKIKIEDYSSKVFFLILEKFIFQNNKRILFQSINKLLFINLISYKNYYNICIR